MAKSLPQPARNQTQPLGNMGEMASRGAEFKPPRPLLAVDGNLSTLTPESLPHSAAEAIKVPVNAPPEVAVTTAHPGMTQENTKEPNPGESEE
jgi:hypothetical protein